ncbi:MAG: energy-coupling factor ABC transporter ATP-binding protein [Alphaproteobacteria bacterium]|nr:energy-coupling factor ABC transporter ATP-binding protein [Alphaproteobacteria bacterium]MDX5370507.1 energy-coupling factor ABC transporter ATP-binding protein [Alphaproteobacteria bacterium]MDX5465006.1 energy-coupling factor ABC transporter ATP-binding protein [Alphaproteobacteria bacterium]
MSATDGIHLTDVSVVRGGRAILDGISLGVTERRVALVGRNGSGKSTLARVIKGLIRPDAGTVRLYGIDPAKRDFGSLSVAGFLFQNSDHQILCPTVLEEIAFGLTENGVPQAEAERTTLALMEAHGIADWRDRAVSTLSEGQRRLVCLLAVLVMEPRVLLLDEPYTGLDIPTRIRLDGFIAQLPQQTIMISHDPDTVETFDRVLWIDAGRVRADGVPADVLPAFLAAMQAEGQADSAWSA